MTRNQFLLTALIGFSFLSMPALAQEKTKDQAKAPRPLAKTNDFSTNDKPPEGPIKDWIDAENALIDPLSDKNKESFFILRNKYSVIRVIKVVERDIANAVDSCVDKNPAMKDKMSKRFSEWKNAVDPIISTAQKQLDKDIDSQKIVDPKKARDVMKLNDAAYEYGEKQIVKTPVTTPEACQGLVDSMDNTEDQMIVLLRQTLLPEDVIRQRSEKAKKADSADKPKVIPGKEPVKEDAKETAKPSEKTE